MIHLLKLEWIGQDADEIMMQMGETPIRRPWVAEVIAHGGIVTGRNFLQPATADYDKANAIGSRGVEMVYRLVSGVIYEIRHFDSWRSERRFFATVDNRGELVKLERP